jgi:hypothetical protein
LKERRGGRPEGEHFKSAAWMTAAGFGATGVGGGGIQRIDISLLPHKSEVDTVDIVFKKCINA